MSVINVEHISKLYGDKMILEDLSCSVDEGDKIGIIGINGTGKSTLLRIIAGEEEADEGKIIFSNGMTIGWMGQNPEFDEESSILKYVCEGKKIEDDYGYESDAKAMLTVLELENFDEKIKNHDFEHEDVLGDIIISIKQVEAQAKEYGHSFEREFAYMLVHGFYHLMGYDHIQEEDKVVMRAKEEKVLEKLEIRRDEMNEG